MSKKDLKEKCGVYGYMNGIKEGSQYQRGVVLLMKNLLGLY